MKKVIYVLFFISVFSFHIGISQVAKIENKLISTDKIVLIGPLNVDSYIPVQANTYIIKYQNLADKLNSLIENFKLELDNLENKRVKNPAKINQINMAIEKFTLELEILDNFIFWWQEHDSNFSSFNSDFQQNFKKTNCYSFILGSDTLNSEEIDIVEIKPQKKIKYYEFINEEYLEVVPKITKEDFDRALENSKSTVKIGRVPSDLVVCSSGYTKNTSNILERIESNRKYSGFINRKFQEKILDIDDPRVIEKTEDLFSDFSFDAGEREFFKEKKLKDIDTFFQIWIKENNKQIIPESWVLENCN